MIPDLISEQVIILYNTSFHKSIESKTLIEAAGCELLFLPPYSPEFNPIEKYWATMKKRARELLRKAKTFLEVFDEVVLSM